MDHPLISYLRLFCDISPEEADVIADAAEERHYEEHDCLLQTGKIAKELFFICEGVLRITAVNKKGEELTYFFLKKGQFCTILQSFKRRQPAGEGIKAACPTRVMVLSYDRLMQLYQQLPWLESLIERITNQTLLDKISLSNAYHGYDAADRYRLFLTRQPEVAMQVAQAHIASYLNITPQSLSRIRKKMR